MGLAFGAAAYSQVNNHSAPINEATKAEPHVAASLIDESDGGSARPSRPELVRPRRRTTFAFTLWWKEVLACLVLLAAVVATFATLYMHQNLPLPDWPYAITIGALLSVYSVLFRMAVAYLLAEGLAQLKWVWFSSKRPLYDLTLHDGATRGPLGALSLLVHRHGPWQSLGCVLVVLTILVGPFTQQVLQYQPCSVPDERAVATIPRTMLFIGQGTYEFPGINTVTSQEQEAVDAGVYTPNPISATCSTGNCTFAPYVSLGYCSTCTDVSDQVTIETIKVIDGVDRSSNNTRPVTTSASVKTRLITTSTLSLDHGQLTNVYKDGGGITEFIDFASIAAGSILLGYTARDLGTSGIQHLDPATGAVPSGCDGMALQQNATWRCRGYGAATCAMSPCVRTYNAQVTNGKFVETVVNETMLSGADPTSSTQGCPWADEGNRLCTVSLNLNCLNTTQTAQLQRLGYDTSMTKNSGPFINYNTTRDHAIPTGLDRELRSQGCIAASDYFFERGLHDYMGGHSWYGDLTGIPNHQSLGISSFAGPAMLRSAHNFGNFSFARTQELYRNVSLSLTNYMRMTPFDPEKDSYASATAEQLAYLRGVTQPAVGVAYVDKTCLRVVWPWLALPGLVAVATFVFILAVVFGAGRRLGAEASSWRSSPLPLVFAGPALGATARPPAGDDDPLTASTAYSRTPWSSRDDAGESPQHVRDMEQTAKTITVRLRQDGSGHFALREDS